MGTLTPSQIVSVFDTHSEIGTVKSTQNNVAPKATPMLLSDQQGKSNQLYPSTNDEDQKLQNSVQYLRMLPGEGGVPDQIFGEDTCKSNDRYLSQECSLFIPMPAGGKPTATASQNPNSNQVCHDANCPCKFNQNEENDNNLGEDFSKPATKEVFLLHEKRPNSQMTSTHYADGQSTMNNTLGLLGGGGTTTTHNSTSQQAVQSNTQQHL